MEHNNIPKKSWEYNLPFFKKMNFDVLNLGTLRILIAAYFLILIWWFLVCISAIINEYNSIFYKSSDIFKILFFLLFGICGSYIVYWGIVKIVLWVKDGYKSKP